VILEVTLPQLSGIDAASQLGRKLPSLKLVFLTAIADVGAAAEAFRSGASAYLLKRCGAEEFMTALRRVMRGESYLSPLITRETINYILHASNHLKSSRQITGREAEILQLLAEGSSMKEAAAILGIRPNTVAFHKYKMMEKLGIGTNAELIQYAMRNHMAPPQRSWMVSDLAGTRLMDMSEKTGDLLALPRVVNERERQLKNAPRTRQRTENTYATEIQ
jgi:DNA-binding NarL/FixJ family response regulator